MTELATASVTARPAASSVADGAFSPLPSSLFSSEPSITLPLASR